MKKLRIVIAPIAFVIVSFPLALVTAYYLLPSERTLTIDTGGRGQLLAVLERSEEMRRVDIGSSSDLIQEQESRVAQLRPDQSLWLLDSRAGLDGLSSSAELESISIRPNADIVFQRRPHRWADGLFWIIIGLAALTGLSFDRRRHSPAAA